MNLKNVIYQLRHLIILLMISFAYSAQSQSCGGCTTSYNSNTSADIYVTTGNNICIEPGVECSGNIYMEGGVLCNQGTITNLVLNSAFGTINNSGSIVCNDTDINTNDAFELNNYPGGTINFTSEVYLMQMGASGFVMNNYNEATINFVSNLNASNGSITLNNGLKLPGAPQDVYPAIFNCGDASFNDAILAVSNTSAGIVNINGSFNLSNTGNKNITNYGVFNIYNSLNVGGKGNGSTEVIIQNYQLLYASTSMNYNYINGLVIINNNANPNGLTTQFNTDGNLRYSSTGTITNQAEINIGNNLILNSGNIINNQLFNVTTTLANSGGNFTNNNTTNCANINNSATGVLTNATDAKITISNSFTNSARANLSKKSLVICTNFYNSTETSTISGSADILNASNVPDVEFYPQLFIHDQSTCNGRLEGYLNFMDKTFSDPNNPVTIDDLGLTAYISSTVVFGPLRCTPPISFTVTPNKTLYCPGENVGVTYTTSSEVLSLNWVYSGTAQSVVLSSNSIDLTGLQSGGIITFTALVRTGNRICLYTKTFTITFGNATVLTNSPLYFGSGAPISLTSTVSIGNAPFQYTWQPNVFFNASGNHVASPTVTPKVSLTYTVYVKDALGCTGLNTIMVIAEPFAVPDKNLNGEYYTLMNNQLLFKYDGQYAVTTLTYTVYDGARNSMNASVSINSTTLNPGDNRYVLNANALATGTYVLELTNEKNEKMYLRFKR
jgi:hypothetical protein